MSLALAKDKDVCGIDLLLPLAFTKWTRKAIERAGVRYINNRIWFWAGYIDRALSSNHSPACVDSL